MYAGPGQDGVAPAGHWQQISIFLSLFDVHINRTPYSGRVEEVTYRPGKWHAAYRFESATENERSEITLSDTVDGEERRVVFRQIVGAGRAPGRDPGAAGGRPAHGPADGPDEVRVAHGRVRASPRRAASPPRAIVPSRVRPSSRGGPDP